MFDWLTLLRIETGFILCKPHENGTHGLFGIIIIRHIGIFSCKKYRHNL